LYLYFGGLIELAVEPACNGWVKIGKRHQDIVVP